MNPKNIIFNFIAGITCWILLSSCAVLDCRDGFDKQFQSKWKSGSTNNDHLYFKYILDKNIILIEPQSISKIFSLGPFLPVLPVFFFNNWMVDNEFYFKIKSRDSLEIKFNNIKFIVNDSEEIFPYYVDTVYAKDSHNKIYSKLRLLDTNNSMDSININNLFYYGYDCYFNLDLFKFKNLKINFSNVKKNNKIVEIEPLILKKKISFFWRWEFSVTML